MASSYPDGLDSLASEADLSAPVRMDGAFNGPVVVGTIGDAVEAVQAELGVNPAGSDATVVARLDMNDTAVGLNTTHRSSDGSDHAFLDQSVVADSSPTLDVSNFSGPLSGITSLDVSGGATVTGTLKTSDTLWISETADAQILLDSGAGRESRIVLRDGTSERWRLSMDQVLGDDFIIGRAPAGSWVANALRLDVDTGDATFEADVNVGADLDVSGNAQIDGELDTDGAITTNTGVLNVGNGTVAESSISLNGTTAGSQKVKFTNGGVITWVQGVVGSGTTPPFKVSRYTGGSYTADALVISNLTGDATFEARVTAADLELGSGGPTFSSGTGSPEGVVTAPVGSEYTREDGDTLGDLVYRKATGTGNTGWVVSVGDTGLQDLSGESLSNSWTVTGGDFHVRRDGNVVTVQARFDGASATGPSIYTLPSGYRPDRTNNTVVNSGSAASSTRLMQILANGSIQVFNYSVAVHYCEATFLTDDAWPT